MIYVKDAETSYNEFMLIVPTSEVIENHCTFNRVAIDDFENGELVFRFELINGGSFTLPNTLFNSYLNLITSNEFIEYCEMVNAYYESQKELDNQTRTVEAFVTGEYNYWDDDRSAFSIVQTLTVACAKTEMLNHQRYEMKYKIIDEWGYGKWVDVCRLYEALFNIERGNI